MFFQGFNSKFLFSAMLSIHDILYCIYSIQYCGKVLGPKSKHALKKTANNIIYLPIMFFLSVTNRKLNKI